MAYARPLHDGRNSSDGTSERPRSTWESPFPPIGYRPYAPISSSRSNPATPARQVDMMDAESSDSDVSATTAEEYRFASPIATPAALPPPPSKHALESSDAVHARLRELQRIEDHNIKKQDLLRAKRKRKDDRLSRRRELQDQRWKAITDARRKHDERIAARRQRENAAYEKFDQDLEEEENNLRRRLKRMKRGLPLDESPQSGRAISSASLSPPTSAITNNPPPAKRHQAGPPGQNETPTTYRPSHLSPQNSISSAGGPPPGPPPPQPAPSNNAPVPQYSFYPGNGPSYSNSYPPNPMYGNSVVPASSPTSNPPQRQGLLPVDRPTYPTTNGHSSPPPQNKSVHTPLAPSSNLSQLPPPPPAQSRLQTSTYDTRPPPPASVPSSSGFAPINAPPSSGFATINSRGAGTPPAAQLNPSRSTENVRPAGPDHTPSNQHIYNANSVNVNNPPPHLATSGKRTPSTTHPYQMSEAFANRHHHCERVDKFNRGIWTSHGPFGTPDLPTGPPVEMYLRCNHDGCQRIDWRTVHGLQCHIVKSHEQPKGTIGSLEKALDRYGVPVEEVEAYERQHGDGTAGTSADPKNLKIKTKTREASLNRTSSPKSLPGSYGMDPNARPAGYRPDPAGLTSSPQVMSGATASPSVMSQPLLLRENSSRSDESSSITNSRPPVPKSSSGGFVALNDVKQQHHDIPKPASTFENARLAGSYPPAPLLPSFTSRDSGNSKAVEYGTAPPKISPANNIPEPHHPADMDGKINKPSHSSITPGAVAPLPKLEPAIMVTNTKQSQSKPDDQPAKTDVAPLPNGLAKGPGKEDVVMTDAPTKPNKDELTTTNHNGTGILPEKLVNAPEKQPNTDPSKSEKIEMASSVEVGDNLNSKPDENRKSNLTSADTSEKTLAAPNSVKRTSRRSSTARKLSVSASSQIEADSSSKANPTPALLPPPLIKENVPMIATNGETEEKVDGETAKEATSKVPASLTDTIITPKHASSNTSNIEGNDNKTGAEELEDGDSITVIMGDIKGMETSGMSRQKDREAAKTPPRRMTNSRSLRRGRT